MRKSNQELNRLQRKYGRQLAVNTEVEEDIPSEPLIVSSDDIRIARFVKSLKIRPKAGGLELFQLRPFQKRILALIVKLRKQHKPIRLIILKSRQLGITTLIQAILWSLVSLQAHRSAQTVAHVKSSARKIHSKIRWFYTSVPKEDRMPLVGGKVQRDYLEFDAPHSSDISVYTAGSTDVGVGETTQYVHWSEFALWRHGGDLADVLMPIIPKPEETWDSAIIIESTARGVQNRFHRMWMAAHETGSLWMPIFIGWKDDVTAQAELAPGELFFLDTREQEYAAQYGLTMPQMKWARRTRIDECGGNWDVFNQEYPVSAELAFISGGYPWFDLSIINEMLLEAMKDAA
jgi:hypothetical protein